MRSFTLYTLTDISACIGQVLEELARQVPDWENRQDVKLCLYELLGNAFEHGSGHHQVRLLLQLTGGDLVFKVYEENSLWQGPGATYQHRCLDEGLFEESGRGLFLVEMLSKQVSFCDECHGVQVVMELKGGSHV